MTTVQTIRIVSHACDRRVRKELVQRICGYTTNLKDNSSPVSATHLCYGSWTLDLIDCDYDLAGDTTCGDVFLADFRRYKNDPWIKPLYAGRIAAAGRFKTVWHVGELAGEPANELCGAKIIKSLDDVKSLGDVKSMWRDHVEGITTMYSEAPIWHVLFKTDHARVHDTYHAAGIQVAAGMEVKTIDYVAKTAVATIEFGQ